MEVPTDYRAGYKQARLIDQKTADTYVDHTLIGDPVMDAVVEELADLAPNEVHQFIQAGMDGDRDGLRNAPPLLRDFFLEAPEPDPSGWITRRSDRGSAPSSATPCSSSPPS